MASSASLRRLQTRALIIRTFHWQRRQYCNAICTLLMPGILFIIISAISRALVSDTYQEIAVEQDPKGAFSPKPFNPESCLLLSQDDLDFNLSELTPEISEQAVESCTENGQLKPFYQVPIFAEDAISSQIGQHDALNPSNNTGILSKFSLDSYEYPPAIDPDTTTNANFSFNRNNYTYPLLYDHFFNMPDNPIYEGIVDLSKNSAIDQTFAAKTISQFSKSSLFDFIYDQWYAGNIVDRFYTAFSFDSFENTDTSLSMSTTVFWNESQPFRVRGCYALCPILSSISNLYSSIYSNLKPDKVSNIYLRKMPMSNPFNSPQFLQLILSIFLVILTHTSLPWTLYFLVYERKSRMRDYMMSMGLPKWLYWIGTYLSLYLYYILSIIVIFIFGRATNTSFFVLNNTLSILILFLLWGNALLSLAFFLEPFFNDPQTAQIFGWLLVITINFLGGPFIGEKVSNTNTTTGTWVAMMLLPSFAYMRSVYYTGAINESGEGIYFTSKIIRDIELGMCNGTGPYCWSYGFLIIDTILLLTLAAYIRYLRNSITSGIKLHPLFFLGFKNKVNEFRSNINYDDLIDSNKGKDVLEEEEKVKQLLTDIRSFDGVVIDGLSKTYMSNVPIHAVRKMSLVSKQNEILTILGHNGAGKSTLFKCLVGEIRATAGEGYINGYSINNEIEKIHSNMGLVTQENIFWDDMNVSEHLYFFGRIKGSLNRKELREEIDAALENVQLVNSRKKRVKQLSGGMKRRLLISIAMMGKNCKFVLLDEPSTGLDLLSRERLWTAINKMKANKSIILTTHSLEEAETLSSRIAIMSNGQLKCIGTGDDLKLRLGDGHRLHISLVNSNNLNDIINTVMSEIHHLIPDAVLDTIVGNNIEIVLSRNTSLTRVLKVLAEKKHQLGIRDWSIQQSSLEDVFLKVTRNSRRKNEEQLLEEQHKELRDDKV